MKEKDFDQMLREKLSSHDSQLPDHVWSKIAGSVSENGLKSDAFDNQIKNKVVSHDSQLPDHVWTNIEKQLERKKPRIIIPYLLAGAGLLAILAIIWWSLPSRTNDHATANDQTIERVESHEKDSRAQDADKSADQSKLVSTDLIEKEDEGSHKHQTTNVEMARVQSTQSNEHAAIKASNVTATNLINKNKNENNSEDVRWKESSVSTETKNDNISHSDLILNVTSVTSVASDLHNDDSKPDQNRGHELKTLNGSNIENQKFIESSSPNTTAISQDNIKTAKDSKVNNIIVGEITASRSEINLEQSNDNQMKASKAVDFLAHLDESKSTKKIVRLGNGKANDGGMFVYDPCSVKGGKKKNRVHCFSFVKKSEITFADFSVGPQYSHKLLINVPGDNSGDLLASRKNTESYMFSYNAQARVGIKTNSGLTGTAGLSYDRYNERFEFFDPDEIRIIILIDREGDTTDVRVEAVGERTVKHTNTLTFISIPFTAGYMWQADKFNVGVHGGLSLNLLFSKGGRIVQDNGSAVTLNGDAKKDIYKTSAGFSAIGGLVFEYKIRDNLSFIAEPNIKYNLRSLTKDSYSLDQRYITTGINVGLRTIINKKITQKKKFGVN